MPWPAGPNGKRRDQVIYYQYRADRARRTLHGIDEQVAKAAKAVAGLAPVKRNRFIALDGAVKSVNRDLEAKACTLAGIKGYKTNLAATPDGEPVTAGFVISSYHELWRIDLDLGVTWRRSRPGNSQPIAIAPEMPISTIAPTTSPCSPAAVPSFPPSFSPIIDITKLMNPNRATAKTIG